MGATPNILEAGDSAHAADLLAIDLDYMHALLVALGVDISHELAPSFALGAFDVMACADIGKELPDGADFEASFSLFETLRTPQPREVREVQTMVLFAASRNMDLRPDRLESLRGLVAPN